MKRNFKILSVIALLLLLGGGKLDAQHYLGIRGGWGGGTARFQPVQETGFQWGLYSGGISYKYYGPTKYVGAIQIDLQYMQRGFMYDLYKGSSESYHRTINSIDLPFIWQPHFYMFNRQGRFFINLGIGLTYNISSTEWWESEERGIYDKAAYQFHRQRDNRLGYGLLGGAGFSVFFGRFETALEGRYYFGYSDILKNTTKYKGNPLRSPIDNLNFQLAVYYRLGKGGIISAPTPKMH